MLLDATQEDIFSFATCYLRRSYIVVSTLPEKQLSEKILVVVAKMLEYKVNLVVYHHHPEPQHLYQFN